MKTERSQFFLIGDSHAVAIGSAARQQGRDFVGGPLGIGKDLERPFYRVEGDRFRLSGAHMAPLSPDFEGLLQYDGAVLSTVGFNSLRFAREMHEYLSGLGSREWSKVMTGHVFRQCVLDARQNALEFYRLMNANGRRVFFVPSPQRARSRFRQLLLDFEAVMIAEVVATGAIFIDTRDLLYDGDGINPIYAMEGDDSHGSVEYGRLVLECFDQVSAIHQTEPAV